MSSGPTTGATDGSRAWASRPALARLVRVVLFVAPILVGWLAVRATGSLYWRPVGAVGLITWIVQAIVVASSAAHVTKAGARRFAPMSTLLNMTMVFPDHAPSRFGVTLRSGNLKKLTPEQLVLSENTQEAAEQAMALVTELGRHEPRTRGHTERVRTYAEMIGQEMGLTDDELNRLRWGVLLHDVGKLTVPAHILNSSERPTDEEWKILQRHPLEGQKILKPLHSWLGDWAFVSLHHHERWDGTGYPVGLKGEEISLGGRIAAVADAFDVITSKRSYKEAMSFDAAREELVRCAGEQFDPDVVRAFLRIGLDERSRSLGFLGWLFEVPALLRVTGSVASAAPATVSATATAATALSVSMASVVGVGAAQAPESIAFADPVVEVVELADISTTSTTILIAIDEVGQLSPSTIVTTTAPTASGPSPPDPGQEAAPPTTLSGAIVTTTAPTYSTTTTATTAAPTTTTTTVAPTTTTTTAAPTTTTTTAAPTTTTTTAAPGAGPRANDDSRTIDTGQNSHIQVLDNDIAGANPLATIQIVQAPLYAKSYKLHNGHVDYQADAAELVDTLVYEICDTAGLCDQATITITIVAEID